MTSPSVSIIIPAYNYQAYVQQAVDSALAQTHPHIEVIAIDDGSQDATPDILSTFDDRITFLQQPNQGLAAARNRGIDQASGEYLFFLDADDYLAPDAIAKMVEQISQPPGYIMTAAAYANVDPDGQRLHNEPPIPNKNREISLRELILKNRFSPAVLVHSQTLKDLGSFDPDFGRTEMGSEDRDLWIRVAATGPVFMLGERLVFKRQHGTNMSSNPERQTASMRRTIRNCRLQRLVPLTDFPFWARVRAVYHYQAGLMYREAHRNAPALREFLLAFIRCPLPCPHETVGLQPWFRTRALLVTLRSLLP